MNREDKDISKLRENYKKGVLELSDLQEDPFLQFSEWLDYAIQSEILEPNAMTLATVNSHGQPTARTLLLKGLEPDGLVFFTNYNSRKAQELQTNSKACLLFFWKELERQVRVEGPISKISEEQSTQYFHSRPKGSQIGAWASPQSNVIPNREVLDDSLVRLHKQYDDQEKLPKPPFWGGYILKPSYFEF